MSVIDPGALLSTSDAAELLLVHVSTVKRWCDDGVLGFLRTGGGHRRIPLAEALAFAEERGIQTFLTPFAPYGPHVWAASQAIRSRGDFSRLISLSLGWLHRGRARRIGELFHDLASLPGVPLPLLLDEGVRGFMAEVGEAWRSGSLRVGEEHLASRVVAEALVRVASAGRRPSDGARGTAVVGVVEGDHHDLGSLCVRVLLERDGWTVHDLGADVPVAEFPAIQRARGAELVCISFSCLRAAPDVVRCLQVLGEFYRDDSPYTLVCGGPGATAWESAGLLETGPLPFRGFRTFPDCGSFMEWVRALGPVPACPGSGKGE